MSRFFLLVPAALASAALARETWITAVVPPPKPVPTATPAKVKKGRPTPAQPTPARPALTSGDSGVVELSTGSRFPVSESPVAPDRIDRTFVRFGLGKPMPMTGVRTDGVLTRLEATYAGTGLAVLGVQLRPVEIEMAPQEFQDFAAEIGATAALEERSRRKETKKKAREVQVEAAKTFALVTDPRAKTKEVAGLDGTSEPLGMPLEIVLTGNPLELRAGATLLATLLRDGKPLGGQLVRVSAEEAAGDASTPLPPTTTDPEGRLSIQLPGPGRLLLASTVLRRTSKEDRKKGEAYRKADWESLVTSLTVQVLPVPVPTPVPAPTKRKR